MRQIATFIAAALGAAALTPVSPASAQSSPLGVYTAEGNCPGQQGVYRGQLTIEANGPIYRLSWKIGPDTYFGSAIEQDGKLAIEYVSAGARGIMSARPDGRGGYAGLWSTYGTNLICQENWTRR